MSAFSTKSLYLCILSILGKANSDLIDNQMLNQQWYLKPTSYNSYDIKLF